MTAISPEKLLGYLKQNERVFVSGSAGEPIALTEAIVAAADSTANCHFFCSFIPGVNKRNLSTTAGRQMSVYFMQPGFAKHDTGNVHFTPMTYSQIQQSLTMPEAIDTVLLQVAPPDEHGQCSLGPQGEFLPSVLANCSKILAVINPNVPSLPNSPSIAFDKISAYTESDTPLPVYDAGSENAVSQAIADNIASLIPNGATLQCGLGKVPNQLMAALSQHQQLRIHSGMVSDSLLRLIDNDVLEPGSPIISTVALGSEEFYKQLLDIPQLEICGVERSHNAALLAAAPKLHVVNSAIEVDLCGQVNAEMLNGKSMSGPGGLPDFAAAARAQADGLSIIALPAADPSGEHSRLVASLATGTSITIPQYNVDAVVTEYGIAMLRGVDRKTRAKRMIDIAHPHHRERLEQAFFS